MKKSAISIMSLLFLLFAFFPHGTQAQLCVKQASEGATQAALPQWQPSPVTGRGTECPAAPEASGYWGRTFGSSRCESLSFVPAGTDSNLLFWGYSGVFGEGSADALFMLLDETGAPLYKKILDNRYDDSGAIWKTQDGGYLAFGSSLGAPQGQNIWAVKFGSNFAVQWQKYFLEPTAVVPEPGGSLLLSSQIFNIGTMSMNLRVSKTDTALNAAWRKDYSGPGSYMGAAVPLADGRIFGVGGWSASITDQNYDAFIAGIDPATGGVLWQTKLGGPGIEAVGMVQPAPGGGIYAGLTSGGSFGGVPATKAKPWIVRFGPAGQLLWQRYIYGAGDDKLLNMEPVEGGGLVISCETTSSGAGGKDILLVRFDDSGNVLWQKTYGGPGDETGQVHTEPDGGFLVTGQTTSFGRGAQDAWLVELDPQGQVLWQRTYGGPAVDYGVAWRLPDGTIVMGGGTKSSGAGDADAWTWKLDSDGKVGPNCDFIKESAMVPRPASLTVLTTTATAQSPGISAATAPAPTTASANLAISDAALAKADICVFNCALECSASAPATAAQGSPIQFQGSAAATGCTSPPTFRWDFGDQGTSTEQNPTHAYAAAGAYNWTLTVEADGLTCTKGGIITIEALPCTLACEASASPASGIKPLEVIFSATVQPTNCPDPVTYSWDFGDGGSSTEQNPTHTYAGEGEFHWVFTATSGAATCTAEGTVTVGGTSGKLMGSVAILSKGNRYILDGAGITGGTVLATNTATGDTATATLTAGHFTFDDLPFGGYELAATFNYADNIAYDAQLLEMGCPRPSGGSVQKQVTSAKTPIQFVGSGQAEINFPRPLVMVHGFLDCYSKWYSQVPDTWDGAARAAGFLSFTPNYEWWGDQTSWPQKADQVATQIASDIQGLVSGASGSNVPAPFDLVTHDMGGLVARAMLCGDTGGSLKSMAGDIFMMGAPNSGTDWDPGAAYGSPMGVSSIVRRFNETYPDLGGSTGSVYCIGGSSGALGSANDDGTVTLASAFNITRMQCAPDPSGMPVCTPFPAVAFGSGAGHVFSYSHGELGSPQSTEEILSGIITQNPSLFEQDGPESPAGGIVWGTNSRTVATASGQIQGLRSEDSTLYPFTISATDALLFKATVTAGSATFELVDPDGVSVMPPRNCYGSFPECISSLLDFAYAGPKAGEWKLKVTPGEGGAEFSSTVAENGTFGATGYAVPKTCLPSEKVMLRLDMDGTLEGVAFGEAFAEIYGGGNKVGEVQLFDDGQHWDGAQGDGRYGAETESPSAPGSYSIHFVAEGAYSGKPYVRLAFDLLDVLPVSHLFTGAFDDSPASPADVGRYEVLEFTAGLQMAAPGKFVVSAQLFDGDGNFIGRASSPLDAGAAGPATAALKFDMRNLACEQFAKPLEVRDLQLLKAEDLSGLDLWAQPVQTAAYDGGTFGCTQGRANPLVLAVKPDEGLKESSVTLLVSGRNFKPECSVALGAGITVTSTRRISHELISCEVTVARDASAGKYPVTVNDPSGGTYTLANAFEVVDNRPPTVSILTPEAGNTVKGLVTITAAAADDAQIAKVSFFIDGEKMGQDEIFPFQQAWNTRSAPNGEHEIEAVATDDRGLETRSAKIKVQVSNTGKPGDCDGNGTVSIGEVQKAINMFLGAAPPDCGVDCDGNGQVSIGEVQKVINAFLGLQVSC